MVAKKGRPTDSLKTFMLRVRMDSETLFQLDVCCKALGVSRSEFIRLCIQERFAEIK